MVLFFSLGNQI